MILATAGHVDHGKSTLVRLLTGIEPDRWEEERRRGLTIDLGFGRLQLANGVEMDVIDVPGHKQFLPNMLAGCGAVDVVLFVVSAREGWREQSEEHLQILQSFGARTGVVAVTFADVVEPQRCARTTAEIAERIAGTFLDAATVVATSPGDEASLTRLRDAIGSAGARLEPPEATSRPRLWIDRSFVVHGAGRVVTGTLTGGSLAVGDPVALISNRGQEPQISACRIRGLHRFGTNHDRIPPGHRVGVNIAGLKGTPRRGDALATSTQWSVASSLHVALLAPGRDRPAPRGSYRLFVGTQDVPGQIRYPADDIDLGGGAVLARVHLARSVGPLAPGDRLVLRDDGTGTTIGGGVVLACDGRSTRYPARHLAARYRALTGTTVSAGRDPDAGPVDRFATALLAEWGGAVPAGVFMRLVGTTRDLEGARQVGDLIVDPSELSNREAELARRLVREPSGFAEPESRLDAAAIDALIQTGKAARYAGRVVPSHEDPHARSLDDAAIRAASALRSTDPPLLTRAQWRSLAHLGNRQLAELTERALLVEVQPFWTSPRALDGWRATITSTIEATDGGATAGELRAALGLSRKFTIALLEWCDRNAMTVRHGDRRTLS